MSARSLFLLVSAAALILGPLASAEEWEERVNEILADPPATGLLVTRIVPGTQAEKAGMLPGDILVSYRGMPTPDVPALNLAMDKVGEAEEVSAKTVRGDAEFTFVLEPGQIGVHLLAVVQGKGREPLPPDTGVRFDFAPLRDKPIEDWYAFSREGARCGVGRISAKLAGETVFVLSEEIIDTGTSLEDHEVTSVVTSHCGALPLLTVFRDRMNDWVRYGLWGTNEKRESVWNVAVRGPGLEEEATARHLDPDAVPAYLIEILAAFMPREPGACFRFRALYEGSGETALGAALYGVGEEEIPHGGKAVKAFRYEWRRLEGGLNGTYWVGEEGRVVFADYGSIQARLTTESEVTTGQPESVKARLGR